MANDSLDVVKRLMLAYNRADFQTALSLIDPAVRVYPRSEEPGVNEVYTGHEGTFEYLGNWLGQWDDYESEPLSYREAPDGRILVEMAERGHLKKSGITVDEPFDHAFTVAQGKVTEWRMFDSHEQALEALGLS